MLHQNALQTARITKLEEQFPVTAKRKTRKRKRKRKRLQHGGTLEYGTTAMQVATATSVVGEQSKKACGGGDHERVTQL
jgi:hypothetical protein